jgi:hypothetical protein
MSNFKGIKSIEPPLYHGDVNQIDNWFYALELYFGVQELDPANTDKKKCAALAGALLRGNAL